MARHTFEKPDENGMDIATLGEQLRALREAQGLSYEDVAQSTHVRPHLLKSIEEGQILEDAAPIYARGFIKTYCEYLMAMDLWRKYSQFLPHAETPRAVRKGSASAVDINHPTPVFRRSSIIWVYIILVIAVIAAAFLLWNQHSDPNHTGTGFFLRTTPPPGPATAMSSDIASADAISGRTVSPDMQTSPDIPAATPSAVSGAVVPLPAATQPAAATGRVDLSWMDGQQVPPASVSVVPPLETDIPDQKLLIEITAPNRLIVQQNGKVLTRRSMTAGGSRRYDVTVDTTVNLSVGNAADISWYGRRYESVGNDNKPLILVFRPDGSVSITSGTSVYFGGSGSSPAGNM